MRGKTWTADEKQQLMALFPSGSKKELLALLPGLVRQFHVAGTRYHLDFALPADMIGIEVDGFQWHSTRQQRQHDSQRDRILTGLGWRVLRFTASEILRNANGCAEEVLTLQKKCTPE